MISLEKLKTSQKLLKNVGYLGKFIAAHKFWKFAKIPINCQFGHTGAFQPGKREGVGKCANE